MLMDDVMKRKMFLKRREIDVFRGNWNSTIPNLRRVFLELEQRENWVSLREAWTLEKREMTESETCVCVCVELDKFERRRARGLEIVLRDLIRKDIYVHCTVDL